MQVEITIPAYNEEKILEKSITKLISFLKNVDFKYNVTIVDADSSDKTLNIAKQLIKKHKHVSAFHTDKSGKGNAIKQAWKRSKADLLCFMDADLSTDLIHLKEMIHLLKEYDIVNGNRLAKNSKTKRKPYRTLFSKSYNFIVKHYLKISSNDLQCGFKGIRRDVFLKLINKARNQGFFFDTELIVWAEKKNYKIKELPIRWIEGKDSKVRIFSTAKDYLIQLYNLKKKLNKQ